MVFSPVSAHLTNVSSCVIQNVINKFSPNTLLHGCGFVAELAYTYLYIHLMIYCHVYGQYFHKIYCGNKFDYK